MGSDHLTLATLSVSYIGILMTLVAHYSFLWAPPTPWEVIVLPAFLQLSQQNVLSAVSSVS